MTIIPIPAGRAFAAMAVAVTVGIALASAQQPNGPLNASQGSSQNRDKPIKINSEQQPNAPPNALQGFSQNRDKPIKINAASLEVRDKDKMATFAGDVHLVQGDTSMRSETLVVFYDDGAPSKAGTPSVSTTKGGPQQNQQIKRVEAKGNVTVTQKDQTATGNLGVFDMRANTVTMSGNVVISQGLNVMQGDTLTVDMTTGVSRISGGRVKGLFVPGAMKQEGRGHEASPVPTREAPRPGPSQSQGATAQPRGLY